MKIYKCDTYQDMSKVANGIVIEQIKQNPRALVSFPGGDTPLGMVREFVTSVNAGDVDISGASYVSLDEWVGLGKGDRGSCATFNEENIFSKLQKSFKQTHIINGANPSIQQEVTALDEFIQKNGPISVSVLGIGLNGHLGFNEEGVSFDNNGHIIPLSPVTTAVMVKYFGTDFAPTHGITQGLGQIMSADTVVLIANGDKKTQILYKALCEPITEQIPASILQKHKNLHVVVDNLAGEKLS